MLTGVSKAWVGNSSNAPIELSNPDTNEYGSNSLLYDNTESYELSFDGKSTEYISPNILDYDGFCNYYVESILTFISYEGDYSILRYDPPFTSTGKSSSITTESVFPIQSRTNKLLTGIGDYLFRTHLNPTLIPQDRNNPFQLSFKQDTSGASTVLRITYQLKVIGFNKYL